ncbi:MAG: 5-formyltetrahydrofolate cyclo-ligase [Micrococcales bacterium]|nr:5-formyltetrahydrofolate cyclo-ligase [Micrococcales bacterium]
MSPNLLPVDKQAWRRLILARRSMPDADSSPSANLALAPGLVGVLPSPGELVAAFISLDSEPDTSSLLMKLVGSSLKVLLPAPGPELTAVRWGQVTAATCALPVAEPGALPQPPPPWLPAEALADCQVVFVPALAVDRSGTRLGRGGGWYDRALRHVAQGTLVLAVVFPDAVFPAGVLPNQVHDRPVDGALTWLGVELF